MQLYALYLERCLNYQASLSLAEISEATYLMFAKFTELAKNGVHLCGSNATKELSKQVYRPQKELTLEVNADMSSIMKLQK